MAYRTFKRSHHSPLSPFRGNPWYTRKTTEETGLTLAEARARCEEFNANRTPAQKRCGTMLEFEET